MLSLTEISLKTTNIWWVTLQTRKGTRLLRSLLYPTFMLHNNDSLLIEMTEKQELAMLIIQMGLFYACQ